MDGQVDGGVVKQDAGAIIRLSNLVFNVKSGWHYYGEKFFIKVAVGYKALFLVCLWQIVLGENGLRLGCI